MLYIRCCKQGCERVGHERADLAHVKSSKESVKGTDYGNSTCLINPRRMRCRVTVVVQCVCVSVTMLATTYLICMSKVGHHGVPCRLLKICIVWTSLEMFCSGDMA